MLRMRGLYGLIQLSPAGSNALAEALSKLPNDLANPVPLCNRIVQLLDVVMPLIKRADLGEGDREILLRFCQDDRRLQNFAALTVAVDEVTIEQELGKIEPVMIHVLHEGLPLCRFSLRVPAYWPVGHIWVRPQDYERQAIACNDPARELHTSLKCAMCDACGRAMVDPPAEDHVIPTEGRTCEHCGAPLVPNAPAVYCSNECAIADAGDPLDRPLDEFLADPFPDRGKPS